MVENGLVKVGFTIPARRSAGPRRRTPAPPLPPTPPMPPFSLLSTLLQALESLAVLMALTRWPWRMDNYVNLVQWIIYFS